MKEVNSLSLLYYASLSRVQRADLAAMAKYQEEIMSVMAVLPGKYHYKQIETALNASGISPQTIYECLATNNKTFALTRFYEALQGPGSVQHDVNH